MKSINLNQRFHSTGVLVWPIHFSPRRLADLLRLDAQCTTQCYDPNNELVLQCHYGKIFAAPLAVMAFNRSGSCLCMFCCCIRQHSSRRNTSVDHRNFSLNLSI